MFNNLFENILLLALLIAFTLIAYALTIYFRGQRATFFGNIQTLERIHGFKRFNFSSSVLFFKALIVALLFLAATDTLEILQQRAAFNTDYLIVLDASSSMALPDFPPNRLTAAKEIATKWVSILPDETRVGFVAYSQEIQESVPMSLEKALVEAAIQRVNINYERSGTALDFALNHATTFYDNSTQNKTLLLITDNVNNVTGSTLANMKNQNIIMYIFGIGGEMPAFEVDTTIPEDFRTLFNTFELNITELQTVAMQTGGLAYRVKDAQGLEDAFREATLQQVQVKINSGYYIVILIMILTILELVVYAKVGAL